jgi:two-component system cell cycle sensor histidine kinase PleC
VNIFHKLRGQKSADIRVLKSQLDHSFGSLRGMRFSAPLWALAMAFFSSDLVGILGNAHFGQTVVLPVIVTGTMILTHCIINLFEERNKLPISYSEMVDWFGGFVTVQALISLAWGMMPWLLWDATSQANQMFLAGAIICAISGFVLSRASHMDMVLASMVPVTVLSSLRFACGDSVINWVCAGVIPLFSLHLLFDGRRLMIRLEEDTRLRFQVEDLARELEETRDDALRKRFEAETANASKTAFLANMSHELRTPLNAILGFSEIIAQECFGPVGSSRYREYATDIHSSGAHLLSLINDLLDVAKIEAGKMEIAPGEIDAPRTFALALKLLSSKARERRQNLTIEVAPSAPAMFADERALKQILINLVSNAVKFAPEGGRISVLGSLAPCGGFQICVQDNGPGIPPDKIDKIFMPFNQVDNRYDRQQGGTGLGLALVRGLAELHGGRAWLESEPGKGCAAYVILPSAGQARAPKAKEAVAA